MSAAAKPSRRSPHTPRGLTRESILDAAIALGERDGPEAVSMRRLGREVGVEAMSLYHHFGSRDELLRAIGDRLLEPLADIALDGGWRTASRTFAQRLRNIAGARPATFRLVGLQPLDTPGSLWAVERLLQVLVADGFSPGQALALYRALASYARGYALAETAGFTVDAAHDPGRVRLQELPRERFPMLGGRVVELAQLDADTAFEWGLDALLDGVRDPGSS